MAEQVVDFGTFICYCKGETDERIKVHKFWFGLRKEIQHDVRMEKLNLDSA